MDKIELKLNSYGKNDFAAQKIVRSGLIIYVTTMNINSIVSMMPEIDPKIRAANNRFVDEKHADSFGKYWIDNPNSWVSPPISITSTGSFDYESIGDITGTENSIGVLRLPVSLKSLVEILDGQHRILGFRLAEKKIISEKKKIENCDLIKAGVKALRTYLELYDWDEYKAVKAYAGKGKKAHEYSLRILRIKTKTQNLLKDLNHENLIIIEN